MTPHTYLRLDLPSRWGAGIHRNLSVEGERIALSWTPICHTIDLTAGDIHRIAEAGREMRRHARESGADTEITIPLDHYPWPPVPSGRDEEWIWFVLYLRAGEITVWTGVRRGAEFAAMTPEEFEGFVAAFDAAERAVERDSEDEAPDPRTLREHRGGNSR